MARENRSPKAYLTAREASDALDAALPAAVDREHCETLERAVRRAAVLAEPGDVVLLAPACASFDQFESFAARGDAFRAAALQLATSETRT